jgi:CRP-like cAMP-binding protein
MLTKKQLNTESKSTVGFRDFYELLESRLEFLEGRDRQIMTMRIRQGASFGQIAILTNSHESTIARAIRRLSARLLTGAFIDCLRNKNRLTDEQLAIARDRFLLKLPFKTIAKKQNCTLYHVRLIVEQITKTLAELNPDSRTGS